MPHSVGLRTFHLQNTTEENAKNDRLGIHQLAAAAANYKRLVAVAHDAAIAVRTTYVALVMNLALKLYHPKLRAFFSNLIIKRYLIRLDGTTSCTFFNIVASRENSEIGFKRISLLPRQEFFLMG
jgi:hypothetical protein